MEANVQIHYLKDYQPAGFEIEKVDLEFVLDPHQTQVTNRMQIRRVAGAEMLVLQGEQLQLKQVSINGQILSTNDYTLDEASLTLSVVEEVFTLEVITHIAPEQNTALEGLYRSGGNYCTQCEAEGFRRITYYLDRPDVLSVFTTKIVADRTTNPVLLSNGNLIENGDLPFNRHYTVWHDPFKKPSYLFALVAGDLAYLEDTYLTLDQREVVLRIYSDQAHLVKCRHAMDSLIQAMRWDEQRFGCIYDLDIYMIVAVDDFNMGAMENKGLNIFNSKYVLADAESATDVDFEGVEAVIAHEYFHNWTGNRITCRDWFQLTLKEGLTVFRDQEFTADQLSPAVKRIEDVRRLRSLQFPEDAGPMKHPIQPQSYIEMNNFYTMTVYEKGAEVVRLYQTLLGRDGFRKGMDVFFARHDGQAVTVEDFRAAMSDANGVNLDQMQAWYTQAGTPELEGVANYCPQQKSYRLRFKQSIPGLVDFKPLLIPIKIGLLDEKGEPLPLIPDELTASQLRLEGESALLMLTQFEQTFVFKHVECAPVASVLREFSSPVKLRFHQTEQDRQFLASHDSDSFNRWEAVQGLALQELMRNIAAYQAGAALVLSEGYQSVFERLLTEVIENTQVDLALNAYALNLPDMAYLIEQFEQVDIEAVTVVYRWMKKALGDQFYSRLWQAYHAQPAESDYRYNKTAIAQRLIKNTCLKYLVFSERPEAHELATAQYFSQSNMTDVMAALEALSSFEGKEFERCAAHFYDKWQNEALVLDKWFALQAASTRPGGLQRVEHLVAMTSFSYTNPNRVRSVVGVFARQNLAAFHALNGEGYTWLAEQVLRLDGVNPQVAARVVVPLTQWRRFDAARQPLMKAQLVRLLEQVKSKDVYELVTKSLE